MVGQGTRSLLFRAMSDVEFRRKMAGQFSLGMAPFANFEMASVATLSVYSEGKRMGTVYIAAAPDENQATLTQKLTSLLTEIIRARRTKLARIV